jgi:hypothetical protein
MKRREFLAPSAAAGLRFAAASLHAQTDAATKQTLELRRYSFSSPDQSSTQDDVLVLTAGAAALQVPGRDDRFGCLRSLTLGRTRCPRRC